MITERHTYAAVEASAADISALRFAERPAAAIAIHVMRYRYTGLMPVGHYCYGRRQRHTSSLRHTKISHGLSSRVTPPPGHCTLLLMPPYAIDKADDIYGAIRER